MADAFFPRNDPETFEEIRKRHPRKDFKGMRLVPTMTTEQKKKLNEELRNNRPRYTNWMKVVI